MRGFVKVKAFTLIEIVVAIAVFAIALTALILAFNPATTGSADPILQIRAAELGQAYLEEIRGKRFDENTPNGSQVRCGDGVAPPCSVTLGPEGETRVNFDDVDDYNGLNEQPVNALGVSRDNYDNYFVDISVAYAGAELGLSNSDAKRIDILVTGPRNSRFNFSMYRTNF